MSGKRQVVSLVDSDDESDDEVVEVVKTTAPSLPKTAAKPKTASEYAAEAQKEFMEEEKRQRDKKKEAQVVVEVEAESEEEPVSTGSVDVGAIGADPMDIADRTFGSPATPSIVEDTEVHDIEMKEKAEPVGLKGVTILGYTHPTYEAFHLWEGAVATMEQFDVAVLTHAPAVHELEVHERHLLHDEAGDGEGHDYEVHATESEQLQPINEWLRHLSEERYTFLQTLWPDEPTSRMNNAIDDASETETDTEEKGDGDVPTRRRALPVALFHPLEPSSKTFYEDVSKFALLAAGHFDPDTPLTRVPYTEWRTAELMKQYQLHFEVYETMYLHLIALSHTRVPFDHFLVDCTKAIPMTMSLELAIQRLESRLRRNTVCCYSMPCVPPILCDETKTSERTAYNFTPFDYDDVKEQLQRLYPVEDKALWNEQPEEDRERAVFLMTALYHRIWDFTARLCHYLGLVNLCAQHYASETAYDSERQEAQLYFDDISTTLASLVYGDLEYRVLRGEILEDDLQNELYKQQATENTFAELANSFGWKSDDVAEEVVNLATNLRAVATTLNEGDHDGQASALDLNVMVLLERKILSGKHDLYINSWADIVRRIRITGPEGVIDLKELFAENRLIRDTGIEDNEPRAPAATSEANSRNKDEARAREYLQEATRYMSHYAFYKNIPEQAREEVRRYVDAEPELRGYNSHPIDSFFASVIKHSHGKYKSWFVFVQEGKPMWLCDTLLDNLVDSGTYYTHMLADYIAHLRSIAYRPNSTPKWSLLKYTTGAMKKKMHARFYEVHFINPLPYNRTGKLVLQYVPFIEEDVASYVVARMCEDDVLEKSRVYQQLELLQQHLLRQCILYFVRNNTGKQDLPPAFWERKDVIAFMKRWHMQVILIADMDRANDKEKVASKSPVSQRAGASFAWSGGEAADVREELTNPSSFEEIVAFYQFETKHILVNHGYYSTESETRVTDNIRLATSPSVGDQVLYTCTMSEFAYRMARLLEPCDYFPPHHLDCHKDTFDARTNRNAFIHPANVYLMRFFLVHNQKRKQQYDQTGEPPIVLQEMFEDEVLKDMQAERELCDLTNSSELRYQRVTQRPVDKDSHVSVLLSKVRIARCMVCDRLFWFYGELYERFRLLNGGHNVTVYCGGNMCNLMGPIDTVLSNIFDIVEQDVCSFAEDMLPDNVLLAFAGDPGTGQGNNSHARWEYLRQQQQQLQMDGKEDTFITQMEVLGVLLCRVFNKIGKFCTSFIMLANMSHGRLHHQAVNAPYNESLKKCNAYLDSHQYDGPRINTEDAFSSITHTFQLFKDFLAQFLQQEVSIEDETTENELLAFENECKAFKPDEFFRSQKGPFVEKEIIATFSTMLTGGTKWMGKLLIDARDDEKMKEIFTTTAVRPLRYLSNEVGEKMQALLSQLVEEANELKESDKAVINLVTAPVANKTNGAFSASSSIPTMKKLASPVAAVQAAGVIAIRTLHEVGAAANALRHLPPSKLTPSDKQLLKSADSLIDSVAGGQPSILSNMLVSYSLANIARLEAAHAHEPTKTLTLKDIASVVSAIPEEKEAVALPLAAYERWRVQRRLASDADVKMITSGKTEEKKGNKGKKAKPAASAVVAVSLKTITPNQLISVELANSNYAKCAQVDVEHRIATRGEGGERKELAALLKAVERVERGVSEESTHLTKAGSATDKIAAMNKVSLEALQHADGLPGVMSYQGKNLNGNVERFIEDDVDDEDPDNKYFGKHSMTLFVGTDEELEMEQSAQDMEITEKEGDFQDDDPEYIQAVESKTALETIKGNLDLEDKLDNQAKKHDSQHKVELSPLFAEAKDCDLAIVFQRVATIATKTRLVNEYENVLLLLPHVRRFVVPVHPDAGSFVTFKDRSEYTTGEKTGRKPSANPFSTVLPFTRFNALRKDYLFGDLRFPKEVTPVLALPKQIKYDEIRAELQKHYKLSVDPNGAKLNKAKARHSETVEKYEREQQRLALELVDLEAAAVKDKVKIAQIKAKTKALKAPPGWLEHAAGLYQISALLNRICGSQQEGLERKKELSNYFIAQHLSRLRAARYRWVEKDEPPVEEWMFLEKSKTYKPRSDLSDLLREIKRRDLELQNSKVAVGVSDKPWNKSTLHTLEVVHFLYRYFTDMAHPGTHEGAAAVLSSERLITSMDGDVALLATHVEKLRKGCLDLFGEYFGRRLAFEIATDLYQKWTTERYSLVERSSKIWSEITAILKEGGKKTPPESIKVLGQNLNRITDLVSSSEWKAKAKEVIASIPSLDLQSFYQDLCIVTHDVVSMDDEDEKTKTDQVTKWVTVFPPRPLDDRAFKDILTQLHSNVMTLEIAKTALRRARTAKLHRDQHLKEMLHDTEKKNYSIAYPENDANMLEEERKDAERVRRDHDTIREANKTKDSLDFWSDALHEDTDTYGKKEKQPEQTEEEKKEWAASIEKAARYVHATLFDADDEALRQSMDIAEDVLHELTRRVDVSVANIQVQTAIVFQRARYAVLRKLSQIVGLLDAGDSSMDRTSIDLAGMNENLEILTPVVILPRVVQKPLPNMALLSSLMDNEKYGRYLCALAKQGMEEEYARIKAIHWYECTLPDTASHDGLMAALGLGAKQGLVTKKKAKKVKKVTIAKKDTVKTTTNKGKRKATEEEKVPASKIPKRPKPSPKAELLAEAKRKMSESKQQYESHKRQKVKAADQVAAAKEKYKATKHELLALQKQLAASDKAVADAERAQSNNPALRPQYVAIHAQNTALIAKNNAVLAEYLAAEKAVKQLEAAAQLAKSNTLDITMDETNGPYIQQRIHSATNRVHRGNLAAVVAITSCA